MVLKGHFLKNWSFISEYFKIIHYLHFKFIFLIFPKIMSSRLYVIFSFNGDYNSLEKFNPLFHEIGLLTAVLPMFWHLQHQSYIINKYALVADVHQWMTTPWIHFKWVFLKLQYDFVVKVLLYDYYCPQISYTVEPRLFGSIGTGRNPNKHKSGFFKFIVFPHKAAIYY